MTDYGYPKPRHSYTYVPRPFPGQRGALVYNGPLNATGAANPRPMGAMGVGMGMGVGVGMGAYPVGYGAGYQAGAPYYPYNSYNNMNCYPYTNYHTSYPNNNYLYNSGTYGYGHGHGHGHHHHQYHHHQHRYANFYFPWQSSYYYPGAVAPYTSTYSFAYPSQAAYYTAAAATQAPVQYTYVQAAATPSKLPAEYYTTNWTARLSTRENAEFENRRVATERGAYKPRRIKPADADDDDYFWVREPNGDWHTRPYWQIERELQPGRWQMDAEIGFLVFHRD